MWGGALAQEGTEAESPRTAVEVVSGHMIAPWGNTEGGELLRNPQKSLSVFLNGIREHAGEIASDSVDEFL